MVMIDIVSPLIGGYSYMHTIFWLGLLQLAKGKCYIITNMGTCDVLDMYALRPVASS